MKKKASLLKKFLRLKKSCSTSGKGQWSDHSRKVVIDEIVLDNEEDAVEFGVPVQFSVYVTPKSWDVDKHGLIYTDPQWIKEFRAALVDIGFSKKAAAEVDYTERGLEIDDCVHLEAGKVFLKQLLNK